MPFYAKQGEANVCFGEDGIFYPVQKDENGYDVPDFTTPLKSWRDEWHTFADTEEVVPHGDGTPVEVVPN